MAVEIHRIDYVDRFIEIGDGSILPITDVFDRSGLTTADPDSAVMVLAGRPGQWVMFSAQPYDRRHLQ